MQSPLYVFTVSAVFLALAVVSKLFDLLPSWSTVMFFGFFLLGLYKIIEAFFYSRKVVSFSALWGFFFSFFSVAFLGQEFGVWQFINVKNSVALTTLFFSMALFFSSFFLPNIFLKIVVFVPAIFLLLLTGLAFLIFYRYMQQVLFIPLWQVNVLVLVLSLSGVAGRGLWNKGKNGIKEKIY